MQQMCAFKVITCHATDWSQWKASEWQKSASEMKNIKTIEILE